MRVINKKIMITGGTSGIGKIMMQKLSQDNIVHNYSRKNDYDLSNDECINKIINSSKKYDYIFLNSGVFFQGNSNVIEYDKLFQMIKINALSNIKIINALYNEISNEQIKVVVTLSTTIGINGVHQAGYNISKKMLNEYIIAVNTEFISQNKKGRIFRFIPHYIKGTKMTGGDKINPAINIIIHKLIESIENGEDSYMPMSNVYKNVFLKYFQDPYKQGIASVEYRKNKNE